MRPRFFNFSRRDPAGLLAPLVQAQKTNLGAAGEPGHQVLALAGWLVLCLSASVTAIFVSTGGWYAGLLKPSWNPPPWIFWPCVDAALHYDGRCSVAGLA
jgi:hypothetical protein